MPAYRHSQINDDLGQDSEFNQDAPLQAENSELVEDEWNATGDAGSGHEQDRINRDKPGYPINEGYLGKASVVRWLEDTGERVEPAR